MLRLQRIVVPSWKTSAHYTLVELSSRVFNNSDSPQFPPTLQKNVGTVHFFHLPKEFLGEPSFRVFNKSEVLPPSTGYHSVYQILGVFPHTLLSQKSKQSSLVHSLHLLKAILYEPSFKVFSNSRVSSLTLFSHKTLN
jgi:hypothetical protein